MLKLTHELRKLKYELLAFFEQFGELFVEKSQPKLIPIKVEHKETRR